jgi:hypothetical protein
MYETENEIVNLQTDLLIKTRETDKNFWNLVPSAIWALVKYVSRKVNAYFGSAYYKESGGSTLKILSHGRNTLLLSGYMRR